MCVPIATSPNKQTTRTTWVVAKEQTWDGVGGGVRGPTNIGTLWDVYTGFSLHLTVIYVGGNTAPACFMMVFIAYTAVGFFVLFLGHSYKALTRPIFAYSIIHRPRAEIRM